MSIIEIRLIIGLRISVYFWGYLGLDENDTCYFQKLLG